MKIDKKNMENEKIRVDMAHEEACREIVSLIKKYTEDQYCPGTDWGWWIGINEKGKPDATNATYQDHYGAITIPVVFYDTTAAGEISLAATCEMSEEEVFEWYVDDFMGRRPDGYERLEFLQD